jgi:putative transcriptional regulator
MKSLKGHFLIAAPQLLDPNFFRTVVLLVQHNEEGALGLILNRPTETSIQDAWKQIDDEDPCDLEGFVHQGGPCDGPLMLVHDNPAFSDIEVMPGIYFTTDRETIHQLVAANKGRVRFFVNYAGWTPGQLEGELEEGGWLTAPADDVSIFEAGEHLWTKAIKEVSFQTLFAGIDPKLIPPDPSVN